MGPLVSFGITVPDGYRASYAGTIRLEATLDQIYLGTRARIDRYTISNDCESECVGRLAEVGRRPEDTTVALFGWNHQVAAME